MVLATLGRWLYKIRVCVCEQNKKNEKRAHVPPSKTATKAAELLSTKAPSMLVHYVRAVLQQNYTPPPPHAATVTRKPNQVPFARSVLYKSLCRNDRARPSRPNGSKMHSFFFCVGWFGFVLFWVVGQTMRSVWPDRCRLVEILQIMNNMLAITLDSTHINYCNMHVVLVKMYVLIGSD